MLRRLTREGDRVSVVLGQAGAGKTYALRAARNAWQASGIAVVGAAVSLRAARGLAYWIVLAVAAAGVAVLIAVIAGAELRDAPGGFRPLQHGLRSAKGGTRSCGKR